MKQKVIRIALGVLVLLIWGAVIGRAVKKPIEEPSISEAPKMIELEPKTHQPETPLEFTLARDPFLDGATSNKRTEQRTTNHTTSSRPTTPKPTTPINVTVVLAQPWPKVIYHGLVANADTKETRVGFLSINGKQCMMRQGTTAQGLTILKMRSDSVWVERDGEKMGFGRE